MKNTFKPDSKMEDYLSALPADIQFEILHSNLQIKTLSELIDCAETLMEFRSFC